MSGETNRLVDLVKQVNPQASSRNYDMAVSAGEQVSVALMASAIEAAGGQGVRPISLSAGYFYRRQPFAGSDPFHRSDQTEWLLGKGGNTRDSWFSGGYKGS